MRTYDLFMINDFSGGLNTKAAPMSVADNQATDILNFEFDVTGALVKRKGRTLYNQSAVSGATNTDRLNRFYRNNGSRTLITAMKFASATGIFKGNDGTGTFTEITGGSTLSATSPLDMLTYRDTLFISNGTEPIQYYQSGDTKADISGSPTPPKGKFLAVCDNRLFVAGDPSAPNMIYFSDIALFSSLPSVSFPAENYIMIPRQDTGDSITGIIVYRDELFVFRRNDIWALMGTGPEDYYLQEINNRVGALSHRAIANTGASLVFASPGRVFEYIDGSMADIGMPIESMTNGLDFTNTVACYYPTKNQVWICCGTTGAKNNRVLVFDCTHRAWSVFDTPVASLCVFNGANDTGELYGGSPDSGAIWQLDTGVSDAGADIPFSYTTKHFSMGTPQTRKTFRRLFFNADTCIEAGAFSVTVSVDFGRLMHYPPPLRFNGFNRWGEFAYGEAVYGGGLLMNAVSAIPAGVSGRYAALTLSGMDSNPLTVYSAGVQNKKKPMRGE